MFKSVPFIIRPLPTLNLYDIPISIINKTSVLISKKMILNSSPLIECFESENELFMQSEPISRSPFLKKHVDLILPCNFYRNLATGNKNILLFRSWFRFEKENKKLSFFNVLEKLDHPSTSSRTISYMFRASEKITYATNREDFIESIQET